MDEETIKSPDFQVEFTRIKSNFERQSIIVFKLLSNFKNHHAASVSVGAAPYLSRLLLRMDYNGFLSELAERMEEEKTKKLLMDYHQQITSAAS